MRTNPLSNALGAALLALGMALPVTAVEEQSRLPLDELRTFADVFNQIRSGYVEEIDDSTLLEYAIQGMLTGLDPHSSYLDPDVYKEMQIATRGEFAGLGIEIAKRRDGYVEVVSPIEGTPAP